MKFGSGRAAIFLLIALVVFGETDAKPPSRIVNGRTAKLGEFKWMVSLTRGYRNHYCGGAIIGPRHILTAAHCLEELKPSDYVVRSGIVDLRDDDAIENEVSRLIMHPDYLPQVDGVRNVKNDIGIVVLKKKLRLGGRLRSIHLPTRPPGRERASVCGWGDINERPYIQPMILQTAEVQVIEDDECYAMGIDDPDGPEYICGQQKNGNVLNGDSGSPLTSDGEVIGIVSSGYGVKGLPDSYTNVYHYLDWINSVLRRPID